MLVNLEEFNTKFNKGLARIIEKTDENIIVACKQYDLEQAKLGIVVELPEEVIVQNIKDLQDEKISLQNRINEIDYFLNQK